MIVDTSALIALLNSEPEAARIEAAVLSARRVFLSAASLVEAGIVAERLNPAFGAHDLDLLLDRIGVEVISVTREHAELARTAYRQFGKGNHPAALNYGDCFSYALARSLGEPLLFVGNDFGKTDIEVVRY
ncbi:MAG TPA: type II toxin-antitoxin system VapC family toxin [Longimicrobium sp.]|jgi:ribonuclease VapC|nr:type II toxin-antitoxin system VapC family toxin [Longimicrobium sp.]